MKILNWFKKSKSIAIPETPHEKRVLEAKDALDAMMKNTTPETIRVAVDKSFLANFGHMYE